jgi:hypothetical protein
MECYQLSFKLPHVKKKEKINKQRNSIKTEVGVKVVRRRMEGASG